MGLQRFRESFAMGPGQFVFNKIPVTAALQEKYNLPSVLLPMRESASNENHLLEKALSELADSGMVASSLITKIREAIKVKLPEGKNLYEFPVSKFNNININRRRYPEKLWERVINDQQAAWKGLSGLADHPADDSDGEFKNSTIVWLDMRIDRATNLVWATGVFVGPYGRLAQEIIDVGGRVGFSSSGFGELQSDGETVDPDSYVIERTADVVLNPSQGVFGEVSHAVGLNTEYTTKQPVKEGRTNSVATESKLEENTRMSTETKPVVSKIEEKKFRRDIEKFLEEASGIQNPQARLTELTDILSYFEHTDVATDLRELVEAQILEEKLRIESLLSEASSTLATFGTADTDVLKAGMALLAEEVKLVESEAHNWEAIAVSLRENNKALKEALKTSEAALNLRPTVKAFGELTQKVQALEAQKQRFASRYKEEASAEKETKAALKEQVAVLKKRNKVLVEAVAAETKKVAAAVDTNRAKLTQVREEASRVKATASEDYTRLSEALATVTRQEQQIERLQRALAEAKNAKQLSTLELKAFQEKVEKDNAPPKILPRFTERVGPYLNFREDGGVAIEAYWDDLLVRHGEAIRPYERKIRGAKTYREASMAYLKIVSDIDENSIAIRESMLPDSTSVTSVERHAMLERAGVRIGAPKDLVERMPGGWV